MIQEYKGETSFLEMIDLIAKTVFRCFYRRFNFYNLKGKVLSFITQCKMTIFEKKEQIHDCESGDLYFSLNFYFPFTKVTTV